MRTLLILSVLALTPLTILRGENPGGPAGPALTPEEFAKVLAAYDWTWDADGKAEGSVHFFKEGTARHSTAWTARWELTAPRTLYLTDVKEKKRHATLTFDEAGTNFWGTGFNGRSNILGWRQGGDLPPQAATPPAAPATPIAPPPPLPSVALQSFFSAQLDKALAPLDQNVTPPRNELTQLQESFADGLAQAPAAARPEYQAAIAVCNAITGAMEERDKAVANLHGSNAVHGGYDAGGHRIDDPTRKELRREGHEEKDRKRDAAQVDNFLSTAAKTQWNQRAAVLRQNIQGLYSRERAAERANLQVKAAAAPVPAANP